MVTCVAQGPRDRGNEINTVRRIKCVRFLVSVPCVQISHLDEKIFLRKQTLLSSNTALHAISAVPEFPRSARLPFTHHGFGDRSSLHYSVPGCQLNSCHLSVQIPG